MLWRNWRSIKSKILVTFIVLLMIPLTLIAVVNYMKSASILEDKAREQFMYLSEATNQQFNQYVANIDTISMNVVEAPVVQERLMQQFIPAIEWTTKQIRDEAEVKGFLNGIHKLTPGISGIAIYAFNGITDFVHPSLNLKLDYDPAEEAWYQEALQRGGSWVISGRRVEREFVNFQEESQELVVTFSRLVKNLNSLEPMGVLAINLKVSQLESILGLAETGRHFVTLDRNGQTVLSTEGADSYLQDNNWLQSSSISPVTGWRSIHLVDKKELFKESRDIRNFIIIITIVLSFSAVVSARLLSSGIVKPILVLKHKMQDVERGNFQGKITVIHRDEIGELTQRFNRMLERMGELLEENVLREQQKSQLEMDALQARINPHFLYNTLMALRIQAITDGNIKLGELITSLVHLLQFSAKNKRALIPLSEELELIRRYTSLLQLRNESFDFHLQVEEGMQYNLVFPFLLQPIVENAVFHGISPLNRKGLVEIKLHTHEGNNVVTIEDDGVGMQPHSVKELLEPAGLATGSNEYHKIGVRNVYERLKLQFGPAAEVLAVSEPGKGTRVTVKWPILTQGGGCRL